MGLNRRVFIAGAAALVASPVLVTSVDAAPMVEYTALERDSYFYRWQQSVIDSIAVRDQSGHLVGSVMRCPKNVGACAFLYEWTDTGRSYIRFGVETVSPDDIYDEYMYWLHEMVQKDRARGNVVDYHDTSTGNGRVNLIRTPLRDSEMYSFYRGLIGEPKLVELSVVHGEGTKYTYEW